MKKKLDFSKGCILAVVLYFLLSGIFYYAAGEQLYLRNTKKPIENTEGDYLTEEIAGDFMLCQTFLCEMDHPKRASIRMASFNRKNSGTLVVEIRDRSTGSNIYSGNFLMEDIMDAEPLECIFTGELPNMRGHEVELVLHSPDAQPNSAVAAWYNPTLQNEGQQLYFREQPTEGTICFGFYGEDDVWTGPHYWKITLAWGILLSLYCLMLSYRYSRGKSSIVITACVTLSKYRFLLKQLIGRDFKIKYRRSVLGAMWSLVNPLLMMLVQYYVFSTIFRADIPNYPVYLMVGIVLFNFFTESTNVAMGSITGNVGLITKVYVPKYIYPISKVLSTGVNLLLSLVPMIVMSLCTGIRITKAWLLMPFILICLLLFCIGVSFILSAVLVFFRDMQFIWSVVSMVLQYATPVFYPESILDEGMRGMLTFNPMYHYIRFFRTIVLQGVSPEPKMYMQCMLISLAFLGVGFLVFRKTQDKFIFYL